MKQIGCRNKFSRPPRAGHGFTLVEMMVVMIIIVILATMLLPVVFRARERALKRQAQAEAKSLVLAIKSYRAVFGKWPAQTNSVDQYYFTNNHMVVTQLMGYNPRSNSFISISANQLDSRSNFLDPRGVPYVISIIQSGAESHRINFTNEYVCERESAPTFGTNIFYRLDVTNRVAVGAGAFMDDINGLTVNSWSDF